MSIRSPMDVLKYYEIRKTKKQKAVFRKAVEEYAENLDYSYAEEKCSYGGRNLVVGDPEKAVCLVTAHYDTCAVLPFPNFLTPCNLFVFLLYQILLSLVMLVPALLTELLILRYLESTYLAFLCLYLVLLAIIWLMLAGPANKHTANDNTSGVVTVLELMEKLPDDLREDICFVLFDLEEAGLLGSRKYWANHRSHCAKQLVLNMDCVGDGDSILLFPSKTALKKQRILEQLKAACPENEKKTISIREKGFAFYPSDNRFFRLGIGVAAFRKSPVLGYYLGRIHTKRDTILDEVNVAMLRDYVITLLQNRKDSLQ